MSFLVPEWELNFESKSKLRETINKHLENDMIRYGIVSPPSHSVWEKNFITASITLRKLEPADLGLKDWHVTTTFTPNFWISHTVPNNAVYGFYKLTALSLEPKSQKITFGRGYTNNLFSSDLNEMYAGINLVKALYRESYDEIRVTEKLLGQTTSDLEKFMEKKDLRCEAYLSSPIIYGPQEIITIKVEPPNNNDVLVIVGFVAEPKGVTIS